MSDPAVHRQLDVSRHTPTTTPGGARDAETALRESEARYRALAAASAQIVWTAAPDGALRDNATWCSYTGQTPEAMRGWGWLDAVHPDDRAGVTRVWRAAIAAGAPCEVDYRVRSARGAFRWVTARAVPVPDERGDVGEWVGTCVDVSQARHAMAAREFLERASLALSSSLDSQQVLDTLAELAVEHLADGGLVHVGDGEHGAYRLGAVAGRDAGFAPAARELDAAHPLAPRAAVGHAWVVAHGLTALSPPDDAEPDLARHALLDAIGAGPALVVPLTTGTGALAALTLVRRGGEARPFAAAEREVAVELARRAASSLENARLFEDAQTAREAAERAAARSHRLQSLTAALSEAASVEQVADVIVYKGMEAIGADAGSLALVRDRAEGTEFELVRTTGVAADAAARHRRFPVEPGRPLSDAVRSQTPVLIATSDEWHARYPQLGADARYESFAGLPIVSRGRVLAGLSFSFVSPQRFDDGVRTFLLTLAEQCAQALERARLFEAERDARREAERAAERTSRLQALTAALAGATEPEHVARVVVEQGTAALGGHAGFMVTPSALGRTLVVAGSSGYAAESLAGWQEFPTDAPVPVAEAFRAGAPVIVANPEERDRRYAAAAGLAEHAAQIGVPILMDGEVLGALGVAFDRPLVVRGDDAEFLLAVGRQCGQAVRRAALLEDAAAAGRARSNFLAVISHELRTPLNAIIGYEELLSEGITGPVTEAQRVQLGRIKASAAHLLGLIDEVLTFSRTEAGKETVRIAPMDVGAALDDAAAMIAPLAERRRLRFDVDRPASPITLETDASKVRQMLVNLLSNAVKFTHVGGVALAARRDADDVVFEVRDSGIGIPADQLQRVFDPFTQVESSATRSFGGTGLGLAVTRTLARLLGGDVAVASEVGMGSTFSIRLPRRWVPTPVAAVR